MREEKKKEGEGEKETDRQKCELAQSRKLFLVRMQGKNGKCITPIVSAMRQQGPESSVPNTLWEHKY